MVESCPQDSVLCSLPQLKMSQWMYSLLQLAGLLFYFFTAGGGRKVAMPLLLGAQWWRMRLVGDWMWLCFHTVGWWQEGYRACKKDCAIYLPNFFQNKWRKSLALMELTWNWLPDYPWDSSRSCLTWKLFCSHSTSVHSVLEAVRLCAMTDVDIDNWQDS